MWVGWIREDVVRISRAGTSGWDGLHPAEAENSRALERLSERCAKTYIVLSLGETSEVGPRIDGP